MQRLLSFVSRHSDVFIFSAVGAIGAANYTEQFGVNYVILQDSKNITYQPSHISKTPFCSTCDYWVYPDLSVGVPWFFERRWFFRPVYVKHIKEEIKN